MTNILPPRYLRGVEDFFKRTKEAVSSLSPIDFSELEAFRKLVDDARTKKPSAGKELMKRIHDRMDFLSLYFIPMEVAFSASLNLYDTIQNIESNRAEMERKRKRAEAEVLRQERQADDLASTGHYSEEKRWRQKDAETKREKLKERTEKEEGAFNDFQLPSLEELDRWEKLSLPPKDKLLDTRFDGVNYNMVRSRLYEEKMRVGEKTASGDEPLYDKYQKFWKELCIFTGYPVVPAWMCCKPLELSPYIRIEDSWLRAGEKDPALGKKKYRLGELYETLVEKEYVEGGKSQAFISIFSGFRFDHENDLPVRWLCKPQGMGANYKKSNLTVLYYLIVALRNWKNFLSLPDNEAREWLNGKDKARISEFFAHRDGEYIDPRSLRFYFNKKAFQIVKELLTPWVSP